jgi:serine/threonine protein kinase
VYRAYDPRLFRDVALKVMRPELLAEPSARRRFLRESQKMAAASSDHVVTIFQSGEVDGFPFLVMELLKGEPLSQRLERQRLSWQDAARIGLETARGLQAVHVRGMVHRDIKPSNHLAGNPWRRQHGDAERAGQNP